MRFFHLLILISIISTSANGQSDEVSSTVNYKTHIFYYAWYGNPDFDGAYNNWNHPIIPHWVDTTWNNLGNYSGGDDIGANFYPQLGCYSSNDPEIIKWHMKQIRDSGIGVVAFSWWGENSFTNKSVKTYLDMAHKYGLKIAFHIEPIYKSPSEFKKHLRYISENYSSHPAFYKIDGKPFYYLYNSYKMNYQMWQSLLLPDSEETIRNTPLDGIFISLWTLRLDGEFALVSGFDGVYTYYATDGFHFGSTTSNWQAMAEYAQANNLIFIPCVGPGYSDTRIRPWNKKNYRNRELGKYYERMFNKALKVNPDFIGITSFNEWHEGTQIEPAISKSTPSFTYEDYGSETDPMFYIKKSKALIKKFKKE